jgi:hypothetical protein
MIYTGHMLEKGTWVAASTKLLHLLPFLAVMVVLL